PTGGYGTYEFTIDGGGSWQSSGNFSNLPPGTYDVRMHDAVQTGCEITLNGALDIVEPTALAGSVTSTNVSCFNANDGTIIISGVSGGLGTYQYSINGGSTWSGLAGFSNLPPATYDVRIRDAVNTGCILTLDGILVINEPAVLNATVSKTDITCFGASDGIIDITGTSGGYGSYEYTINGGGSWQPTGNYTGLGPGNYNVLMRDAIEPTCIIVLNNALQINQPVILNAVVTPTNITCNTADDGIIDITAPSGGSGAYEYSIDGGASWQAAGLFGSLPPATYNVQIRDAASILCVRTLNSSLTITEPAVITANLSSSDITCFNANDGTITISSPAGGYGTYDYTIDGWTTWQTTGSFTNLLPGFYNVQIRDRAQILCVTVLDPALELTEPTLLSASVASTNVSCFGANNGTITISGPSGGYGTYQYSVNGGSTWQNTGSFIGLIPATYNVRIRDAANTGCFEILDGALVISQPAVLSASYTFTNVTCYNADDATITIASAAGGYGTYEYTVDGGATWQSSANFTALSPGFYNIRMRDAANTGCVRVLDPLLMLTEPGALGAAVAEDDITCNGADDGKITISLPTGGYGTYEY
ncbi:MAG: SprB repeat-containing protein, partial [Bacteroidales bacterium]|nr:SprB repeat-containing protein [Bacteroidales bacterium]